ncbi:MAG: hypothetical protein WBK20_09850 [Spirochaetota bacterium]
MNVNFKSIKVLIIGLFVIISVIQTQEFTLCDEEDNFIYSNNKNWGFLEKSLLSNVIFEYPPCYYFKFSKNNIVYTIYYYYTVRNVTRKIFKGYWKVNKKEGYIDLKIRDVDGKDFFVSEKYYSYKMYVNKETGELDDAIVFYEGKQFTEPEDVDEGGYYKKGYLILGIAKEVPEEKDKTFLNKLK